MFNNLSEFLSKGITLERSKHNRPTSRELQVATVAVLSEAALANNEIVQLELSRVLGTLFREFGLSDHDGMELLEIAEFLRKERGRRDEFIAAINQHFSLYQREHVLCLVWRVLIADGGADPLEIKFATHLRKLLGLSPEQALRAQSLASQPLPAIGTNYQDSEEEQE